MLHVSLLKLTESRKTKNPESQSTLRKKAVDKLVEKHFSIRQFKFEARRNSSQVKALSQLEDSKTCRKSFNPVLEPLVLRSAQNKVRPKSKWPTYGCLKSHDIDPPRQEPQPLREILQDSNRLQSERKLMIEPKVLRRRVVSSQKRRIYSADQRPQLPLLFTFGKEQFVE